MMILLAWAAAGSFPFLLFFPSAGVLGAFFVPLAGDFLVFFFGGMMKYGE
jgi:hypothetical protein